MVALSDFKFADISRETFILSIILQRQPLGTGRTDKAQMTTKQLETDLRSAEICGAETWFYFHSNTKTRDTWQKCAYC